MSRSIYYQKISELGEARDFKRVLDKWDVLSDRIGVGAKFPTVLPDLLWIAKSGIGKTNLLKLLSEYLYECGNLMEFQGNVKYLEFMLDYCPPDRPFGEIGRMACEVANAAGCRSHYKGIVSIDIEEWLGHCEEKNFITFLEYLSDNSDDWLIIFSVASDDERDIRRLESILTMYFRLEKSVLCLPDTDALLRFVCERLALYDLMLDSSAEKTVSAVINILRGNKYFDGYKTLISLCRDIVYEIYSGEQPPERTVSAAALAHFAPDSAYISRVTWNAKNKSRIGFIKEDEI